MKTVKLKIRKGISLLYAGIFVYTFSACSAGRTEQQPNSVSQDEQQLYIGDSIAVAQTQYGKVRGYLLRDIYTFCGIPYGASTAGENRFMPPREPEPWEGIRPAVFLGRYGSADYDRQVPQHIHYIYRPLELLWRQRGLSDAKHLDARLGRHEETPCAGMDSWRRFYKWQ